MPAEAYQPFYREDSRVSLSHLPENDSAVKTNGGCGQSTLDSFGKSTPLGLLLRMLPLSPVFQSSGRYTKTLNPKVTKSGFCIFELRTSAPHTSGQDVSLLPTPTASQDYKPIRPKAPSEQEGTHGVMLCAALAEKGVHFLPTPLASINDPIRPFKAKELMRHTKGAKRFGKMLPGRIGDAMPSLIGKTIHPQFVEWMMGFPNDWTNPDCRLSAMQLCRAASSPSSRPSEELREVSAE